MPVSYAGHLRDFHSECSSLAPFFSSVSIHFMSFLSRNDKIDLTLLITLLQMPAVLGNCDSGKFTAKFHFYAESQFKYDLYTNTHLWHCTEQYHSERYLLLNPLFDTTATLFTKIQCHINHFRGLFTDSTQPESFQTRNGIYWQCSLSQRYAVTSQWLESE